MAVLQSCCFHSNAFASLKKILGNNPAEFHQKNRSSNIKNATKFFIKMILL